VLFKVLQRWDGSNFGNDLQFDDGLSVDSGLHFRGVLLFDGGMQFLAAYEYLFKKQRVHKFYGGTHS
jgi:hypothetical protein